MAKTTRYRVEAEAIIAHPRVWERGDIVTSDELEAVTIKHHLAHSPPLLTELTEEAAPPEVPGG